MIRSGENPDPVTMATSVMAVNSDGGWRLRFCNFGIFLFLVFVMDLMGIDVDSHIILGLD